MQADFFASLPASACIAGVDEAGRGPWAGPVFAAAVILNPDNPISGLNDSKKLSAQQRGDLALLIKANALDWFIASASVAEIDTLNILQATMLAMSRACKGLRISPDHVLVDGNRLPTDLMYPARAVVKGDATVAAISAASILAKTARDADCLVLHKQYPDYGFNQHKGYGTALHQQRLEKYGPCDAHRRSFAPIKRSLQRLGEL